MVSLNGYKILGRVLYQKLGLITVDICDVLFCIVEGRVPLTISKLIHVPEHKKQR